MKALVKISFVFLFVVCTTSCSTSNSVVSNRLIQKRKYTKGWFVNHQSRVKSDEITQNEKGEKIAVRNQDVLIERVDRELVGRLEKRPLNHKRKISTQESFGKTEEIAATVVKREDTKRMAHVIDSDFSVLSESIVSSHNVLKKEVVKTSGKQSQMRGSYSNGSAQELLIVVIVLVCVAAVIGLFFEAEVILSILGVAVAILGIILLIYLLVGFFEFILGI